MDVILDFLNNVLGAVFAFLPDSPFPGFVDSLFNVPWLGAINYFVPVSFFLVISGPWIICVGVYYLYKAILTWVGC